MFNHNYIYIYIYIFIFIFAYLIFTYPINFFWLNIKITKDGTILIMHTIQLSNNTYLHYIYIYIIYSAHLNNNKVSPMSDIHTCMPCLPHSSSWRMRLLMAARIRHIVCTVIEDHFFVMHIIYIYIYIY